MSSRCANCRNWRAEVTYGDGRPMPDEKNGWCVKHNGYKDFDDWCNSHTPWEQDCEECARRL